MTDDDSSASDGRVDDGSPGTRGQSAGDGDDWGEADARGDVDGRTDAEAQPPVDEDLRDVVEYDLADLAEDEDDYPAMDDPVDPQSIDVENAAFVILGVLAMVALIAHLVLGVL